MSDIECIEICEECQKKQYNSCFPFTRKENDIKSVENIVDNIGMYVYSRLGIFEVRNKKYIF